MAILGIDTSNYATSLAVVDTWGKEVVAAKKRMLPVKTGEGGLRQSDAVFHHTVAVPLMFRELYEEGALHEIAAIGVSQKPRPIEGSYMPCFLTGVSLATALAATMDIPLKLTTHQQGHVAAALYGTGNDTLAQGRALVFHFSGGTSELLLTNGYEIEEVLGQSLDLYAGQAIDRLGIKLGFPFPAGEAVSSLALSCHEDIRPKITVKGMDCHFSGLQNQCEKMLIEDKAAAYVAKYCLSAIAYTALAMLRAARKTYSKLPVVCAGGVMASVVIKNIMKHEWQDIYFVPPQLSSDNAVGAALIAAKEFNNGQCHRRFGAE